MYIPLFSQLKARVLCKHKCSRRASYVRRILICFFLYFKYCSEYLQSTHVTYHNNNTIFSTTISIYAFNTVHLVLPVFFFEDMYLFKYTRYVYIPCTVFYL